VSIVSRIASAVIVGLAISTHLRLSALEPEGHAANESAEEIAQEILTGQPAHTEEEEGEESEGAVNNTESSHSENEETPEERTAEGK
jgi:hypothetical protein